MSGSVPDLRKPYKRPHRPKCPFQPEDPDRRTLAASKNSRQSPRSYLSCTATVWSQFCQLYFFFHDHFPFPLNPVNPVIHPQHHRRLNFPIHTQKAPHTTDPMHREILIFSSLRQPISALHRALYLHIAFLFIQLIYTLKQLPPINSLRSELNGTPSLGTDTK